jgi:hypothetical protein
MKFGTGNRMRMDTVEKYEPSWGGAISNHVKRACILENGPEPAAAALQVRAERT